MSYKLYFVVDEFSGSFIFDSFEEAFNKLKRNVNPYYNEVSESEAKKSADESSFYMSDYPNGDYGHIHKVKAL